MVDEAENWPDEKFPEGTHLYKAVVDDTRLWVADIEVVKVDYAYTPKRKKRKASYTVKGMNCNWNNGSGVKRTRTVTEDYLDGHSRTRKQAIMDLVWANLAPEEQLLRAIFGEKYPSGGDVFERVDGYIEKLTKLKGMLLEWKDVLDEKE